jgi:hypothetical protein
MVFAVQSRAYLLAALTTAAAMIFALLLPRTEADGSKIVQTSTLNIKGHRCAGVYVFQSGECVDDRSKKQ